MKVLVGAFNKEKALIGAFSVIVKTDCETDGALLSAMWRYDEARCGHCAVPRAGHAPPVAGSSGGREIVINSDYSQVTSS